MHRPDKLTKYQREFSAVDYIHDYDVDPEKGEMYLVGREEFNIGGDREEGEPGVDYMMANRAIRNLRLLQGLSTDPIIIHMKTCGGDFVEGMAIYEAIRACPNHVTIINYAAARSMSSIIFQAAEERLMVPYSWFMMHEGTIYFDGTEKSGRSWVEFARRYHDRIMFDIYADRMQDAPRWQDKTKKQVSDWVKRQMNNKEEVYLTAEETVELGLADAIFGVDGEYDWESLRVDQE